MHAELNACMRNYMHVCGNFWVHVSNFGCMYAERLGAKYADFGCMYMETFGCMYADVGCKSMQRLGACMTVFACLTVGSYTLHVYPVAWAQGPRPLAHMGPMGPRGLGPWALWAPGALGPYSF